MKDRWKAVPSGVVTCLLLLTWDLQASAPGDDEGPALRPPVAAAQAPTTAQTGATPPEPPREPRADGRQPGRGLPTAPPQQQDEVAPPAALAPAPQSAAEMAPGPPIFVDRAGDTGLDFVHFNGRDGRYHFAEVMGSGVALLDYDGDGDLDVFLVQGAPFEASPAGAPSPAAPGDAKKGSGAGSPPPPPTKGGASGRENGSGAEPDAEPGSTGAPGAGAAEAGEEAPPPPRDRLYRNLLIETGELAFEDVTEAAGIDDTGYGMGVAVGDVNQDGHPDIYVTALGSNRLWLNGGDGTFTDATDEFRADDPRWSTAASFFDADLDGDLDLYITNYVAWSVAADSVCHAVAGHRDYCGPLSYPPVADRLLENRGDSRFFDASTRTGIRFVTGAGLGSLAVDLGGDPRPELYVANDASANQLWQAGPPPTGSTGFEATLATPWRDVALESGLALNGQGWPEGSMGIDAGDYDEDGDLDLFLTHVHRETNTLYRNDGGGHFTDVTERTGLAVPSLGMTGFGAGFIDYDNDGWLDLLVVNGTVTVLPELAAAGEPFPLHQKDQLFRNLGRAGEAPGGPVRFADISATAGDAFQVSRVSRGAAFGDVDNDGDTDVLINDSGAPARLLINQVGQDAHWLGLRLLRPAGDGVRVDDPTATVTLELPSGRRLLRRVRTDGSYLSAHDPRVLFGLGEEGEAVAAVVRWSGGAEERFELAGEPVDRYVVLVQGEGEREAGVEAEGGK